MRKLIGCFLVIAPLLIQAQPAKNTLPAFNSESLAEKEVGWMVVNKLDKESPTPKTSGKYRYSAQQVGTAWNFLKWMQKGYTPKGYLGNSKWFLNAVYVEKNPDNLEPNSIENSLVNALPQTYGAYTKFYAFLKYDSKQKIIPENNLGLSWHIAANELGGISLPVIFISDSSQYYFTMPHYYKDIKGDMAATWHESSATFRNFRDHPNLANYNHYFIPRRVIDFESWYVTIMTKDNQPLPFEKVTIGECLEQTEKKLMFWYHVRLHPDKPGERKKYVEGYFEKRLTGAKANMARLKEKYKDRWNDVAEFSNGMGVMPIDFISLSDGNDIDFGKNGFDRLGRSTFPVMKVKKETFENCKKDTPQWIVIRWNGNNEDEPRYVKLMDHILNKFNMKYVYDYYFGKDKVITPYAPLNGTAGSNVAIAGKANTPVVLSEAAKAAATDKNVIFFDDFSGVAAGSSPSNWSSTRNKRGDKVTVFEVDAVAGKWLKLQRNVFPSQQFGALKGDFTISFDLLVQKGGVMYATKGFEFGLYVNNAPDPQNGSLRGSKYISLRMAAGDINRSKAPGYFELNSFMPEGYFTCKKDLYYYLPTFTATENINRVTMKLQRRDESFIIWQNGNKLFECAKAIPAAMSFSDLRFNLIEDDSYYMSNFKIAKE